MQIADIRKMRDRAPFRAFQVHLTSGETLPVRHPDYLSLPPRADTELFVVWVDSEWNLVDSTQVVRLSVISPDATRPRP